MASTQNGSQRAQSTMAQALRALRQGRTGDAAALLQSCLNGEYVKGQKFGAPARARSGMIPWHVFTVPGIGGVTPTTNGTGLSSGLSIQWPKIGSAMRVVGMTGTVLSGTSVDFANLSLGLECNGQEKFASSGFAEKQIPYACLFPSSQPIFSFCTPRRPYGVPVYSTQNWTAFFKHEGSAGAAGTITPTLEFIIESDDPGSTPSFDTQAYGDHLGVHVFRPDTPSSVPTGATAGNPSGASPLKFTSQWPNQRIVAWIGEVLSANNQQDIANATVAVSPNGAESLVTNGQIATTAQIPSASLASLFGNSQGRPERWMQFASQSRYGMEVWPDEIWQLLYFNLGASAGPVVPVVCFRTEND